MSDDARSDDWEDDGREYDSGPYCQHFAEPWDCDVLCKTCSHRCDQHDRWGDAEDRRPCNVEECGCQCYWSEE